MKRGDVHWAELAPRSGSEQSGRRPIIIVTNDGFNQTKTWASVIVVPITSSARQLERGPTALILPAGTAGLRKASVAVCHQITTLDRSKVGPRIGSLPDDLLSEIEDGIRSALDID